MQWRITLKDGQEFVYDQADLTLGETFDLKRLAGLTIAEFEGGFTSQDPATWRFIYYLVHKRAGLDPGPYGSIDFSWRDLSITPIEAEPEPDTGGDPDPSSPVPAGQTETGEATQSK